MSPVSYGDVGMGTITASRGVFLCLVNTNQSKPFHVSYSGIPNARLSSGEDLSLLFDFLASLSRRLFSHKAS